MGSLKMSNLMAHKHFNMHASTCFLNWLYTIPMMQSHRFLLKRSSHLAPNVLAFLAIISACVNEALIAKNL
jgi:hypothetical protein